MKQIALCALVAASLFTMASCTKTPEEKYMDLFNGYIDIIVDNQNNCDVMGEKLSSYVDKNAMEFKSTLMTILKQQNRMAHNAQADDPFEEFYRYLPQESLDTIANNECNSNQNVELATMKLFATLLDPILTVDYPEMDNPWEGIHITAPDGTTNSDLAKTPDQIINEAKINLKFIAEGALAYYQTEHCADASCTSTLSREYPKSSQSKIGPKVGANTINKSYTATDSMASGVWEKLNFMPRPNEYFTYYYTSDGKSFAVKASASIKAPCDHVYMIKGGSSGGSATLGVVTDLSMFSDEEKDCNAVKLTK